MASKARPFVIRVPLGFRGGVWEKFYQTNDRGRIYNWYRVVGTSAQMILPDSSPPPVNFESKKKKPDETTERLRARLKDVQQRNNLRKLSSPASRPNE